MSRGRASTNQTFFAGENSRYGHYLTHARKGLWYTSFPRSLADGYAMLMSPNKGETAVYGCHCPGDMVVGKCAPVQLIGIVKKKYQD